MLNITKSKIPIEHNASYQDNFSLLIALYTTYTKEYAWQ